MLVLLLVVSALFFPPKNEELLYQNSLLEKEEVRLYNIRQLTFSGENAEAYFSANGKRLIFQSHDGDSLCDQIYIMDIASNIYKNELTIVNGAYNFVSKTDLNLFIGSNSTKSRIIEGL